VTVLRVGLTGGIGSGKSTVAAMLGALGAFVVDCDGLGRQVIEPHGRAYSRVIDRFGPDIVRENESGWVLPIRSAGAFIARLRWCDANREALARMVERIYSDFQPRGWDGTAAAFETICDTAGALTH